MINFYSGKSICQNQCHVNAKCIAPNRCECQPGYSGDGRNCSGKILSNLSRNLSRNVKKNDFSIVLQGMLHQAIETLRF